MGIHINGGRQEGKEKDFSNLDQSREMEITFGSDLSREEQLNMLNKYQFIYSIY